MAQEPHDKRQINMLGLLSHLKTDIPRTRSRNWKRRHGSTKQSFMSHTSMTATESGFDLNDEFLHAAEFGDIPGIKRMLSTNPDLNVNCSDALGRTGLRLAVKNEHLEIVEVLLEKSMKKHIYEAVLQAISAGHTQIAATILRHRRYLEFCRERKKLGDTDDFFNSGSDDTQFSQDMTPLILAAQKNQYEIVKLLLLRGESIPRPHKYKCHCQECENKKKYDQLRLAKCRLNAYRALASEAYISLNSKDPILVAFDLSRDLKKISGIEKYFQKEYNELLADLSEYVVRLLDRVRNQQELEFVLNKRGPSHLEKYSKLARLKLALRGDQRKFVAHASCQQLLVDMWNTGMTPFKRASLPIKLVMIFMFTLAYPFLVVGHVLFPTKMGVRWLNYPNVRFITHMLSFLIFLTINLLVSLEISAYARRDTRKLSVLSEKVYSYFKVFQQETGYLEYDIPIRPLLPTLTESMLSLWIIGFLVQECRHLYEVGLKPHLTSIYNMIDFGLIFLYSGSFALRYICMFMTAKGLALFTAKGNISDSSEDRYYLYWMNADRYHWDPYDPINVAEAMYSVATIISFARISYLLPANESLGPMQISLGRMLKDILKFLSLFAMVFVAFLVGLQNLYWYYRYRHEIEIVQRNFTTPAETSFGDLRTTLQTVFWTLFGRGEPSAVTLSDYNNSFTEDVGYCIYGAYNIAMVTVLLNMLIAMMSRSFQLITEDADVEWKYSRSVLYMEYISDNTQLPAPLNLLEVPKSLARLMRDLFCSCACCDNADDMEDLSSVHENHHTRDTDMKKDIRPASSIELPETPTTQTSSTGEFVVDVKPAEILTYQVVIQRIVQRYIFDIQREADVTEDDFEEIKQDISSFRFEMLHLLNIKDNAAQEQEERFKELLREIAAMKGPPVKNSQSGIAETE